jgi:hypothetical protein
VQSGNEDMCVYLALLDKDVKGVGGSSEGRQSSEWMSRG